MEKLLIKDVNKELVHAIIGIKSGWCHEIPKKRGITHFLEHAIFLGNRIYPFPDDETQKYGIFLNGMTLPEETIFFFTSYKDYLEDALSLLISLIFYPDFNEKVYEERDESIITAVYNENDFTSWELSLEWAKNLIFNWDFRLSLGTKEDLNEMSIEDLKDWHKKFYHFDNSFIMLYGDFSLDKIDEIIKKSNIPKGGEFPTQNKIYWNKKEIYIKREGMKNVEVVFGFRLPKYDIKWKIISILLGNYPISKLWDEKFKKFTYTVGSELEWTSFGGGLFLYFGVTSDKNLDLIQKNLLSLFQNFDISGKELEYAKKLASMEILKMKEGGEKGFLNFLFFNPLFKYKDFHTILNDINKTKKEDILNLINENLKEENMVKVFVGN
ncbi:MAG: insulinase family protein [Caldisericia bacterium]|nr:insulinase family protein [Caldisericia bacterium]